VEVHSECRSKVGPKFIEICDVENVMICESEIGGFFVGRLAKDLKIESLDFNN
jgi:hypothetical protein